MSLSLFLTRGVGELGEGPVGGVYSLDGHPTCNCVLRPRVPLPTHLSLTAPAYQQLTATPSSPPPPFSPFSLPLCTYANTCTHTHRVWPPPLRARCSSVRRSLAPLAAASAGWRPMLTAAAGRCAPLTTTRPVPSQASLQHSLRGPSTFTSRKYRCVGLVV